MRFISILQCVVCIFIIFPVVVQAQAREDAAIGFGETGFVPSLRIDVGQTDNALRRNTGELEDTFTVVQPELVWSADKGFTEVSARYLGAYSFSDLDQLDFDDHLLEGNFQTEFSKRSKFTGTVRLALNHLPLGQDIFTRLNPEAFDQVEFSSQSVSLAHTYGSSQARGQIISRLFIDNRDFTNNLSVTESSSRLIIRPSVAFSYRLTGDTRSFVSVSFSDVDRAANGTDRSDVDLVVGATWKITGRTGGSASIGAGRSALDGADDRTEAIFNVGLFYTPKSFSRFNLDFERGFFNDGSGTLTEVAVANELNLSWRYNWSSRLFHIASFDFSSVERECPQLDDETREFSFQVGLQVRRWLAFGLGASTEQRENGNCPVPVAVRAPDYDRQEIFAFTRVNL